MSVVSMGIIGGRTAANAARPESGSTAEDLLTTIGKYIPTDVTTLYVAAVGSIALAQPAIPTNTKFWIAVGIAALAAFATWVIAHTKARETQPNINPIKTLVGAWFEILAAPAAFMAWSAAIPANWFDWGNSATFMPALVVGVVAIVIGGLAVLLNRSR